MHKKVFQGYLVCLCAYMCVYIKHNWNSMTCGDCVSHICLSFVYQTKNCWKPISLQKIWLISIVPNAYLFFYQIHTQQKLREEQVYKKKCKIFIYGINQSNLFASLLSLVLSPFLLAWMLGLFQPIVSPILWNINFLT